ncbi:MAG: histidine phosphatase family protein [Pseudomonadota bacterium]
MALVYFVRHGKAAAGFSEDPDPGLNDLGRAQAAAVAPRLIATGAELFSSPLRRARETAQPVEAGLGRTVRILPEVSEIVAPVADLAARGAWLRAAMQGNWTDLTAQHQAWRRGVVDTLLALPGDAVIFSHFIAINAAVSHALNDPRMVCFSPENCSVTVLDNAGGVLRLVELGESSATVVG